jgi:hypothetical protein
MPPDPPRKRDATSRISTSRSMLTALGLFAAVGASAALALTWILDRTFGYPCGNRIAAEHVSPDARHRVVVFARDCGATTGFSAQVSVLGTDEVMENEAGNAFVVKASGDTPEAINAAVSVTWNGANEVVIHSAGVPRRAETAVGDVKVLYR